MRHTKECLFCGKTFEKPTNESMKNWVHRHKFCSVLCSDRFKKGKHSSLNTEFTKERHFVPRTAFKKGQHPSMATEFKKGHTSHNWKGDEVGYRALHGWVRRKKGTPKFCKHCGTTRVIQRLAWANVDHKYKRKLEDYIALCYPCHQKYDLRLCR